MIKELQLGKRTFPNNIIQGPLAGVSCAPFRRLTWRYSQPAFSYTEMISCKTLLYQSENSLHRFVSRAADEGPVCFQLSASDPHELAAATQKVTDYGADLIDLNCGCPVNKIRKKGAGSKLLQDVNQLYKLIAAMKQNTCVPVSVKIRVEGNGTEKFHDEIIAMLNDAGPDFVVVHGRHWTEHYETPCRVEQIQFFVEHLTMPVIGNGDVSCSVSLKRMLATGCAGVMIARAGVGQPWLIQKLMAELKEETFIPPSSVEIGLMFIEHVTQLVALLGSERFAILQARKFAKYYARGLQDRNDFCKEINECENLLALERICQQFFK